MASENISLTGLNDKANALEMSKVEQLTSCGLSLLPLPDIGSVSQSTAPNLATFQVNLKPQLNLPGCKDPVTLTIKAGSIAIEVPRVPLPELVLFTRDFTDSEPTSIPKADLLLVADPMTSQFLPSVDLVSFLAFELR